MRKRNCINLSIKIILCFFVISIFFNSCSKNQNKDFNIVLIVIDTLRSDHLSFYGYEKQTAPFLNQLSKNSVIFTNTYSSSSWTAPATASIFTSLYPFQHGVILGIRGFKMDRKFNPDIKVIKIPDELATIPEILKGLGYKTYGVSDNWNIDHRMGFTRGFDKFSNFGYKSATVVNQQIEKNYDGEWEILFIYSLHGSSPAIS